MAARDRVSRDQGTTGGGDQCMQVHQVVPVGFDTDPCTTTRQAAFHRNHGVVSKYHTVRQRERQEARQAGFFSFMARRGTEDRSSIPVDSLVVFAYLIPSDQTRNMQDAALPVGAKEGEKATEAGRRARNM